MKKLFTLFVAVLLTASVFAQSPERMSYQAVIRNSSDVLVTNTKVGMQISILQGSVDGTPVYSETQTPTTNANGLVSIEIGNGATSDDFSGIDWSGPYFIKTEIDPTGGTNYTITGTSQLLSVPYAFHAKSAERLTGEITESDPVYSGSEAVNITATDIANLDNLSGTNTGDQDISFLATKTELRDSTALLRSEIQSVNADGSETKVTAGTNVSITGTGTTENPYLVNATGGGGSTRYIGELYGGGVVFWLDHTGEHGLILGMIDLSTTQIWSNILTITANTNDWDGASNTALIIGQSGHTSSSAKLCDEYTNADYGTGIFSDWYLPSNAELNLISNNFYQIQKVLTNDGNASTTPLAGEDFTYQSSSERYNDEAWAYGFGHFSSYGMDKTGDPGYTFVRAVRAF